MDQETMLDRARRLTADLPGVEVSSHYVGLALKIGGKAFANPCREPGALSVYCPLPERDADRGRTGSLFRGRSFPCWPAVLVRMDAIDDDTLKSRLTAAWQARAPKRLVSSHRPVVP